MWRVRVIKNMESPALKQARCQELLLKFTINKIHLLTILMRCIIVYNVRGNPLYLDGPPKFSHWIWMKIGQSLLILVDIVHQRIKKWPILAKAELEKSSQSTKKIFFKKACNFMRNCLIVCILLLHILFL